MKVDESRISIASLRDMLIRGDLTVNNAYQRAPGLWPNSSRSYFIDTILEGYPFPKIYLHEYLDKGTKKVRTEIVDGQQRITTIVDFIDDKFVLGKNSVNYKGNRFSDLDEETQDAFLFYTVSTDVIREAGRAEILQMFRRMNAYTLPLNAAEKRHSEYFGEFKDMVTRVLDHNYLLSEWSIFTTRQIVRMADAGFVADLVLAMEEGVVSTSDAKLNALYKKYDDTFPNADFYEYTIVEIFNFIAQALSRIRGSFITKPYGIYALFCALYHNKYGLKGFTEITGLPPINAYIGCQLERASSNLLELSGAYENGDMHRFPEFISAMSEGSNRMKQRTERIATLCRALRNQF